MAVILTTRGKTKLKKTPTPTTLRHVMPSDIMQVDAVCRDARNLLGYHGQTEAAFTVDLLLREFINNAVIHGNQHDPDKQVEITVKMGRSWIVLTIRDEGPGFDWRSQRRTPPDTGDTSGRGIAIGAQFAQRMQFNRKGNQVMLWINKELDAAVGVAPEFAVTRDGQQVCISLGDKLTASEVPGLQPALKEELDDGADEIAFDLTATTVLDSTGIGLLIATSNSLRNTGGQVRLVGVSDDIMKLLSSMRLVDRLHAQPTER